MIRKIKPKCVKGTACGYTCIRAKYVCSARILKRDADALLASAGISAKQAATIDTGSTFSLPDYNVVKTLGQGAYGSTVLTDRGTAVKTYVEVFTGDWKGEGKQLADIKSEYEGLQVMSSLGIGPMPLGLSTKDGQIEMEYVEGTQVYDAYQSMTRLNKYRLADKVAASAIKLHRAGYSHNDLHQNNVLVKDDGGVTVIDAGMVGKVGELFGSNERKVAHNGLDDMVRQFGPRCQGNLKMSELYDKLEAEGVLAKYKDLREQALDLPDPQALQQRSKAEKYMHAEYLKRLDEYYD